MALLMVGMSWLATLAGAEEKEMLLFAHRGGAFEYDENTLEAFRATFEEGLLGFETDIRMSRDGALVILHDDSLDRTHEASGPIENKTAEELRQIKSKQGNPVLFLDDLLDYFADKPGIYLELEMKVSNRELYPDSRLEEFCQKLIDTVREKKPEGSDYVLTSFDERALRVAKALDPDADLLLISGGPVNEEITERAQKLGIKRIGCRMEKTSRASVQAAQKAGLIVSGWPGHTLQDYHLALGLGVDAFCTDIPVAVKTWRDRSE